MIFLTVGNPTQSFNRLIKYFDELVGNDLVSGGYIQRCYSDYEPKYCEYCDFLALDLFKEKIRDSGIIITHGGEVYW